MLVEPNRYKEKITTDALDALRAAEKWASYYESFSANGSDHGPAARALLNNVIRPAIEAEKKRRQSLS